MSDPLRSHGPGSSAYGIFQVRLSEWGAISNSRGSSWPRDQTSLMCPSLVGRFFSPLVPPVGEGNGNPLQYSCLQYPVDRGAWWAAVHGVTQSRTQLKWLSMHVCFGEGNGTLLQYSCLENPRDRGDWWAAIYGVAQSRTRLKPLSSSSSRATWEAPKMQKANQL